MASPSKPIDVLLGATRFYPVYAGPAIRFKRYEPGLRQRGIAMRVFSLQWEEIEPAAAAEHSGRQAGLLEPEFVDGIPIQRVRLPAGRIDGIRQLRYHRALARYGLAPGYRPDLIQLLSIHTPSVASIARLRRAGIPVVYTHTMARDPSIHWLKNRYWRVPFDQFDCVVTSSGVMREGLLELGVRSRVEVIPNGVDLERFRPLGSSDDVRARRRELGVDPDAELVVFVGGFLSHRKGVDVLLDAWARVARNRPRARLLAVGPHVKKTDRQEHQVDFVRDVLAKLESTTIADSVTFTGAVENVEHYLQAADVFVFPSRREGMPNVVPEAFGCALPTIMAPFVGLPAEFGRADSEYELTERTPDAFAAAIERMLDQPERRRAFGQRARAWVEQRLALDRSLDMYASLYKDML